MRLGAREQLHKYIDILIDRATAIDYQVFPSILPRELCVEGIQLVEAPQQCGVEASVEHIQRGERLHAWRDQYAKLEWVWGGCLGARSRRRTRRAAKRGRGAAVER